MSAELHWIHGPWLGKLAVAPRPRGGDWLADDLANWKKAGIATVLSLLTEREEQDLGLQDERPQVAAQRMRYLSLPIPDRQTPDSESALTAVLENLDADLLAGKNVLVHCRQGVGRSGLVVACMLVAKGLIPQAAVEQVSAARGVSVPETIEQRRWIDQYAAILAATK